MNKYWKHIETIRGDKAAAMLPLVYESGVRAARDFKSGRGSSLNPYIYDRLARAAWREGFTVGVTETRKESA